MNYSNQSFISLRCPLYDGCHTLHQFKTFNLWVECAEKTPFKLRCQGMRGVCIAMGIIVSSSSTKNKELHRLSKRPLKNNFSIDSRSLRQRYHPFS